jgi:precorrin-6A/cobalt-precorrin-6A reductase
MKILILGGTSEARDLAARLTAAGHAVVTSLAGRTSRPLLPAGELRVGKFGGIPGLVAYLKARGIERLVDATHPYAGLISINAVAAAEASGIPLLRLMRPAWPEPEGAAWRHVPSIAAAAEALPSGARGFITTGHEGLAAFVARDDCRLVARLMEPPDIEMGEVRWIEGRPPYTLAGDRALFREHGFSHLVTKNSGGDATAAKLVAAREAGAEVIMVARPVYGPAVEVASVEAAVGVIG